MLIITKKCLQLAYIVRNMSFSIKFFISGETILKESISAKSLNITEFIINVSIRID